MGEASPGPPEPNDEEMIVDIKSLFNKEQDNILNFPHRLSPIHAETLKEIENTVVKAAENLEKGDEKIMQLKAIYNKVKLLQNKKTCYNEYDKGPFTVVIENINSTNKGLHPMDLGKKLFKLGMNAKKIVKRGLNKVGVTCHTFSEANDLLFNKLINSNEIISYIPQNFITCKGIIKNVSLSVEESDILRYAQSSVRILEARRLNRKKKENNVVSYVPSNSILLTFDGKSRPEEISIFACFTKVLPYVPPLNECHKCLRFGHTAKVCKSKGRCCNCGENHEEENCNNPTKCVFCHSEHKAFHKECLEYNRQHKLRELMYFHDLSYPEASRICPPLISNPPRDNFARTPQAFPVLALNSQPPQNHQGNSINQHPNHNISSQYFHPKSHSTPVKRKKISLIEKPNINKTDYKNATFPDPTRSPSPNGVVLLSNFRSSQHNLDGKTSSSYASVLSSPSPSFSPFTPKGSQAHTPYNYEFQSNYLKDKSASSSNPGKNPASNNLEQLGRGSGD